MKPEKKNAKTLIGPIHYKNLWTPVPHFVKESFFL